MVKLGFDIAWVTLIIRCVASIDYIVGANGVPSKKFTTSKGLRQKDPLNPYLFFICARGFSALLHDAKINKVIKRVQLGRGPLSINHLSFADDSLLFEDASMTRVEHIHQIITTYELASRQKVYFDKSLISFRSNVLNSDKEMVSSILGVRVSPNPKKYLDLPMMVGHNQNKAFAYYVAKFCKKIKG